jgi:hypothetical protein
VSVRERKLISDVCVCIDNGKRVIRKKYDHAAPIPPNMVEVPTLTPAGQTGAGAGAEKKS